MGLGQVGEQRHEVVGRSRLGGAGAHLGGVTGNGLGGGRAVEEDPAHRPVRIGVLREVRLGLQQRGERVEVAVAFGDAARPVRRAGPRG